MVKKYIDEICFIGLNVLVFLIFLPWLMGHYATDTYNIMNVGYEYYSIHNSLIDGRVFMFLIMQFADFIKIAPMTLNFILLSLALIVSNVAVLIIKKAIYECIENKNILAHVVSYILSYTLIYNFMYIENLYFFESLVMAISILLSIIAAKLFVAKEKNYLIKTIFIELICVFLYQGTITSFFAFTVFFSSLKELKTKKFLENNIVALIIIGIVSVCNLIFIKMISQQLDIEQIRLSYDIIVNVKQILTEWPWIILTACDNFYYSLLPSFIIILSIIFISLFKYNSNKQKYIFFFIFIMLEILVCTELPYVISISAYYAGRTRFAVGALISILITYLILNCKYLNKEYKNIITKSLYVLVGIYFVLNVTNYIILIDNTKAVNEYEKEYVYQIEDYIERYESMTNKEIKEIRFVFDIEFDKAYAPDCTRKSFITINAVTCGWSSADAINFYTGRDLVSKRVAILNFELRGNYEIIDNILYLKIVAV